MKGFSHDNIYLLLLLFMSLENVSLTGASGAEKKKKQWKNSKPLISTAALIKTFNLVEHHDSLFTHHVLIYNSLDLFPKHQTGCPKKAQCLN